MPEHYKALVVVMSITLVMFAIAKRTALEFMSLADFKRRRNLWFVMLATAFLIPNYWIYVLVAAIGMSYCVRRDSNPAALYMFLLIAMPPFGLDVPTFGVISQVFPLDHLRLLSFVVLLPTAFRLKQLNAAAGGNTSPGAASAPTFRNADMLVLAFCLLQMVLWLPYDSMVAVVRRGVMFAIDILLPYFVLSRACRDERMVREAMASFVLVAVALAPVAVVETLKGWLLFAGLADQWGNASATGYLMRGTALRATVTGGHSIVLGYAMMMAMGLGLALRSQLPFARRWAASLLLLAGLGASMSRGPWLGAVVLLFAFQALGPKPFGRTMKLLGVGVLISGILLATPWGASFVDRLPWIGSDTEGSVGYREQLAVVSWGLVQQNPFFGTLNFMQALESLRQGEGIIDMVNAYAGYALQFGLVGCGLFLAFFLVIILGLVPVIRRLRGHDPDVAALGGSLAACLFAGLVVLGTVGMYLSISNLTWALAGLAVAFGRHAPATSFSAYATSYANAVPRGRMAGQRRT